jgi:hypothetical protein
MTCQFCYDRPIVRATGHNGELVPMNCPVCGRGEASALGMKADTGRVRYKSKLKGGSRKNAARASVLDLE